MGERYTSKELAADFIQKQRMLDQQYRDMKKLYSYNIIANQPQLKMAPSNARFTGNVKNSYSFETSELTRHNANRNEAHTQPAETSYDRYNPATAADRSALDQQTYADRQQNYQPGQQATYSDPYAKMLDYPNGAKTYYRCLCIAI